MEDDIPPHILAFMKQFREELKKTPEAEDHFFSGRHIGEKDMDRSIYNIIIQMIKAKFKIEIKNDNFDDKYSYCLCIVDLENQKFNRVYPFVNKDERFSVSSSILKLLAIDKEGLENFVKSYTDEEVSSDESNAQSPNILVGLVQELLTFYEIRADIVLDETLLLKHIKNTVLSSRNVRKFETWDDEKYLNCLVFVLSKDIRDIEFYHLTEHRRKFISKNCWGCGKYNNKIMKCSKCGQSRYCDIQCQRRDWDVHKKICKLLDNL